MNAWNSSITFMHTACCFFSSATSRFRWFTAASQLDAPPVPVPGEEDDASPDDAADPGPENPSAAATSPWAPKPP